jgi:hypothetical protein
VGSRRTRRIVFSYNGPEMAKGDNINLFYKEEYKDYNLRKLLRY